MRQRPASTGGGPVEVALAEPEATGTDSADAVDRPVHPRHPSVRRLRRRWWLVALVVAVLAATLVDAVGERRDARRLAALAQIPGITTSLRAPLEERWRTEGVLGGDLGGVVLVRAVGDDGGTRAVDATTGRALWTRPHRPGVVEWCRRTVVGAGRGPVAVACVASAASAAPAVPADEAAHDVRTTVSAVDGTDGATIASLPLDRPVLDVALVDGDLVVLTALADGRVGALRWDVDADDVVWRMSTFERVARDHVPAVEWFRHVVSLRGFRWVAVDLRSGHEVPAYYLDDLRWLDHRSRALDAGRTVEWPDAAEDAVVQPMSRVRGPGGEILFSVPGRPWLPAVDDGSGRGVLVVATPGARTTVRAVDTATGDPLWTRRIGAEARPAFVVDGVLLAAQRGSVVALDVRTGDVRWAQGSDEDFTPVTDGRYVLLKRDDGGVTLSTHRLDDGTTVGDLRAPSGTAAVTTTEDGHVLTVGDGWLAGLG